MIQIDQVSKHFKAAAKGGMFKLKREPKALVHAVRNVSVQAKDGCITGLLGANGAGKTTTLRMLAGLLEPDSGSISVDGISVASEPRRALARMGILGDAHGLYPRLTARENIVYFGQLQGMETEHAHARVDALAQLLDMKGILERRADGFSQGERMKTSLARALVHDPANIVLDEPTNGLDVLATRALRETLRHLRSAEGGGKCIIFSTHIMPEVEQLCEQVIIVAQGRSVARGTVDELLAQSGQTRFEDAFVKLAFDNPTANAAGVAA